jgi:carboxyl-terminal processing protease
MPISAKLPRFANPLFCGLLLLTATGCSVLDPNRILTRTQVAPPVPVTPVPMPEENFKQTAIDFVWTTVNERYYDPKLNGLDWKAVRAKYEPQLLATKTDDEFWELLDKMTGELKDSHTRIHSPKLVQQQRNNESHSLGVGFVELDDAIVVTSVNPQSDAWWAGVRAGMTIRTIDGEAALPLYRRLVAESRDTSTPWARTRGAVRKINAGDIGTEVSMGFVRPDGTNLDVRMKRRKFSTPPDFTPRVLPSGFGYIRFSNFLGNLEGGIVAEIEKMKDTPGMIIDLRNNGGGSGAMSANLLSRFFKEKQTGMKTLTRTGKPISVFFYPITKMDEEIKGIGDKAYTKPVVVLTNESSASASEIFSSMMKETKRATLIGQRTCGCLLGYFGLADVPGGAQMAYSEIGFVTKSGGRVEGDGVAPDIEVKMTRDDYLLNRDRILERAVAFLTENTKPASKP